LKKTPAELQSLLLKNIFMKKFLSASLLLLPFILNAQITITENDMPSAGNDFISTNCVLDFTIDLNETGANHSWDYSGVVPVSSLGDTFLSLSSLPFTYFVVFILTSNLADKGGINFSAGGFALQDVYTMYKKTSDYFEITGYGGTLNGLEIPLAYGSKDVVYRFPLNFGNEDSSDASVTYSFPGLFYFAQQRHRVNQVDGWGTIQTPAGTFNALRVKSTITDVDSFYVDTLGFGTGLTLKSYEYKWLAQNGSTPVFQLGAQDVFGVPVLSSIQYQDTTFHTGINEVAENTSVKIFPNPANDFIQVFCSQNQPASVFIYDAMGNLKKSTPSTGLYEHHSLFTIDLSNWPNGIYFIRTSQNGTLFSSSFIVNH